MPKTKPQNEPQMADFNYEDGYDEVYYDEAPKRGAVFYVGIAIAAIALIAALVVGTFFFLNSTQTFGTHRSGKLGQLDNKTKEEIIAELNRVVEEGKFNISIANVIDLANGSSEGEFKIENSPANRYNMQVTITEQESGDVIYTSGVIEPNYHIQYARLDKSLPAGTYNCVATFHAIDPETEQETGQAAVAITVIVRS